MQTPRSVKLSESAVHMRPHGRAEFTRLDFSRVAMGEMTYVWDPGLDGVYGGEGFEQVTPDQPGERHLDSNEVLYLISGAMSVRLEGDAGTLTDVPLQPGEAVIVPQGIWHRLIVDEPSRYLWLGSGRTELRKRKSPTRERTMYQGMTAMEVLRAARKIVLVDWPSREVPDTLARAGYDVVVHGGPAPDDYSVYLVENGEVVVRRTGPPEQADVVYSYRPLDELPRIVEHALRLGAGAVWMQLSIEEAQAARLIVEDAGLTFVDGPYLPDAVRAIGDCP